MINIKPIIYKELEKVAENVTDTYPDDWENFPIVIFWKKKTSRMKSTVTKSRNQISDIKSIFSTMTQLVL